MFVAGAQRMKRRQTGLETRIAGNFASNQEPNSTLPPQSKNFAAEISARIDHTKPIRRMTTLSRPTSKQLESARKLDAPLLVSSITTERVLHLRSRASRSDLQPEHQIIWLVAADHRGARKTIKTRASQTSEPKTDNRRNHVQNHYQDYSTLNSDHVGDDARTRADHNGTDAIR